MLIKCAGSRILNSKYIETYVVEAAATAREYANGTGITIHPNAPRSGYVVCAFTSGKVFLTDGLPEAEANRVLDALFSAFQDRAETFDVENC